MTRERWMALYFVVGATCFVIAPVAGYANLVGTGADAATFFAGSILFTAGGGMQSGLAFPQRRSPHAGQELWWAAAIQSAGTLLFNVTTYEALGTAVGSSGYDGLVWLPDALGSVCFLVSGLVAYRAAARSNWLPTRGGAGWWEPSVNLLGCVLFGISAIAGYAVPSSGSLVGAAAANWSTALGAVCFLACAAATLRTGRTLKSARLRRVWLQQREAARRELQRVGDDVKRVAGDAELIVGEVELIVADVERVVGEIDGIAGDVELK